MSSTNRQGSREPERKFAMAKLRHIALSVADLDQARKFFEDAFDMEMVGKAGAGVYMSDGTINIALLARHGHGEFPFRLARALTVGRGPSDPWPAFADDNGADLEPGNDACKSPGTPAPVENCPVDNCRWIIAGG